MTCNWVKLQRKIITYLITWHVGNVSLLHPHISGIFVGNVHLHGLGQFPKYSQFQVWYLLSVLLMCGGLLHTLYFSSTSIDKNCKSSHIRRIESKYQAWNRLYFGNWINPCKCTFPKKMPEMCGWRRTFLTCHAIKYVHYFPLKFYSIVGRHSAGIMLLICQPGAGLSAGAIASFPAAGNT